MDAIHIHLLLNHIPILGTLFGIIILAAGLFKNNRTLIVTALVTFIATALITIPTNFSGENAEDAVEKLPGVTEQAIENHEEAAEPAFAAALIVGVLSIATLFLTRGGRLRFLPFVVLVASLATFVLMVQAGNLGGMIRHTELTPGSVPAGNVTPPDSD
ncbi:MAG: hypothetical protein V4642_06040 [Bacteroidota bacterium]